MGRFCYCSKVLQGKTELVREHWKTKKSNKTVYDQDVEENFWRHLKMTGFESWLQKTPKGDFIIHCLEGESLNQIFKGLREQIASGNDIALHLQSFYQSALGKDYSKTEVEPKIENLLDISLPRPSSYIKRGFFFPFLPHMEEEHRQFRHEAMGNKRLRHEASMKAFGVFRLSTWLQSTPDGKYIIVYTERHIGTPESATSRIAQGQNSAEWQEISAILMRHTGLNMEGLSPEVEWLTQP